MRRVRICTDGYGKLRSVCAAADNLRVQHPKHSAFFESKGERRMRRVRICTEGYGKLRSVCAAADNLRRHHQKHSAFFESKGEREGMPSLPAYLSDGVKKAIEQAMQPRKKERPATAEEFIALLSSDAPVVVPAVAPANDEATKIIAEPEETLVEEPIEKPSPELGKPVVPEKKEHETPKEEPTEENKTEEESNLWKLVIAAIIVGIFVFFCSLSMGVLP